MNVWERVKDRLSTLLPEESFQSWFARTGYHGEKGSTLFVAVPNSGTKDWVEKEFQEQVEESLRDLALPYSRVEYVAAEAPGAGRNGKGANGTSAAEALFGPLTAQLNDRYTFDNFVVGSCNQFAHAAAKAVAEWPARRYNPLFIYGGVGMGKTHLMHAIGRSLITQFPEARVVYTTSERFMNQLITCIRTDQMPLFQQYYRTADILLVDDVQILANKERTQEEFFHTFNDLHDHQKQIVLSSDSPPKNTAGLVDRLRSRFEWGLLVDVQAPDFETKVAILDKKAESLGVKLPNDVRVYIATKTKSNVRELEGALVKMVAAMSVTGAPLSVDMAKQALKHLSTGQERKITVEVVIRATAERYGMQPAQIKQKSNVKNIALPRQVAMYIAKEVTTASLPEIGRAFGGKHHTTVLHSVAKIERDRHTDPDLNRIIHSIIDSLQ